jgi:hypothetical protein
LRDAEILSTAEFEREKARMLTPASGPDGP